MKLWLYYTWVVFKNWTLFTFWRVFHSKEDREELIKLYVEQRFQKRQMAKNVAFLSAKGIKPMTSESWYAGTISHDWEDKINAKILNEKAVEDVIKKSKGKK